MNREATITGSLIIIWIALAIVTIQTDNKILKINARLTALESAIHDR